MSAKPEGEGGEGFYIAQSGRPADLLATPGGRMQALASEKWVSR